MITYVLRGVNAAGQVVEFEEQHPPREPPSLGYPYGRKTWCEAKSFKDRELKPLETRVKGNGKGS